MMKLDFEAIFDSILANKGKIVLIGLAALLLVGIVLFTENKISNYFFNRSVKKTTDKVHENIQTIDNINAQIANLKEQKAAKQQEIKDDTATFTNQIYGREDLKAQANQALANFNATVANANSNINVTGADLERKLKQLEELEDNQ